jgi:hypothetical protein
MDFEGAGTDPAAADIGPEEADIGLAAADTGLEPGGTDPVAADIDLAAGGIGLVVDTVAGFDPGSVDMGADTAADLASKRESRGTRLARRRPKKLKKESSPALSSISGGLAQLLGGGRSNCWTTTHLIWILGGALVVVNLEK